jgi:predicted transcriptional regulator
MELQVPSELAEKLTRMAQQTGRRAEQVALDLLSSSVAYDEWFRSEVEKGRVSARDGALLDHQEVLSRIDTRYRT